MSDAPLQPLDVSIEQIRSEVQALLRVCATINEPGRVDEVLGTILSEARQLAGAEAGSLYVRHEGQLRFVACQNDALGIQAASFQADRSDAPAQRVGRNVTVGRTSIAGYVAEAGRCLRIDDAYAIPPDAPYRIDRTWDRRSGYRSRSMLVVPMRDRKGEVIGVLQLINRLVGGEVVAFEPRQEETIGSIANVAAVTLKNAQLHEELYRSHLDTVLRLSMAAEFRDCDTGDHIRRMSCYCEVIARAMGLSPQQANLMLFASPMHDVGKLGISDAILRKPGKLTAAERRVVEQHTEIGAAILDHPANEILAAAHEIALGHHERWDGTGYPRRVAGEDIPVVARIASVADVFDAMTANRCYRAAMDPAVVTDELRAGAGTQFDPAVVEGFLAAREGIMAIYEAYPASRQSRGAPAGQDRQVLDLMPA